MTRKRRRNPFILFISLLLFTLLFLVACGTLDVGIERTATPDNQAAVLATENARLSAQVTRLAETPVSTSIAAPLTDYSSLPLSWTMVVSTVSTQQEPIVVVKSFSESITGTVTISGTVMWLDLLTGWTTLKTASGPPFAQSVEIRITEWTRIRNADGSIATREDLSKGAQLEVTATFQDGNLIADQVVILIPGVSRSDETPALTLSPTPDATPSGVELSRSLYFLSTDYASSGYPRSVWRLDPGDTKVERITPPDLDIASFDVWLGDGRMAYGTRNGQLYVVMPEQEPRLLYDASLQAEDAVEMTSIAWSPEGTRLAYSVHYVSYNAGSPGQSDGLWLLTLNDEGPIKLLSNRHLDADRLDVNDVRTISDPIWSPDGTALILTGYYWEWSDILWLDPIAPDPDEANPHDPPGELWLDGSWAGDSQSILLSGTGYSAFSNLVRVGRDSNDASNDASHDAERLIEGQVESLFIYKAQELPAGIAFLASRNSQETQLYLGQQAESGFSYAPAGPDHYLCSPGYLRDIAWDPTGRLAILSCDRGVQLVSLDGTVDVDLTPFLGPLAGEDHLKVFWGQNRKSD